MGDTVSSLKNLTQPYDESVTRRVWPPFNKPSRWPTADPVLVKAEELRPWKSTAATVDELTSREKVVYFSPLLRKALANYRNFLSAYISICSKSIKEKQPGTRQP